MPKPTGPNRRELMMGAAAAATVAASLSAHAQSDDEGSALPELSGKSVLITGCSSGFGRLGAEVYARLGAKVFATMRNLPRTEARELANLAEEDGLDIHVLQLDVTSDDEVIAGVDAVLALADGKIDVLINNAGIAISGPIEAQDVEATRLIFETNVFGAQRMIRAVLPSMRAAGEGLIFNIASQLGRVIIPGIGQYSPTKFALEALSEQLAYETVSQGIEVTIIEPGGYPTGIWEKAATYSGALKARMPEELLAAYPQLTAGMGERPGPPPPTDPLDVPRAIAETIALPAGMRPLRRAVHPERIPQEAINRVSADVQLAMLGSSPYGPWVKAVLE